MSNKRERFSAFLDKLDEHQPMKKLHRPEFLGDDPGELSGWTDHLYLGSRRALKVLVSVGGVAATVAGYAVLNGTPIGPAVTAAALIAVGSAAAMGTEKTIKERKKSKGVRWFDLLDVIVSLIKLAWKSYQSRKEKVENENG